MEIVPLIIRCVWNMPRELEKGYPSLSSIIRDYLNEEVVFELNIKSNWELSLCQDTEMREAY